MSIGYYPIKENEIKQIIKMNYSYLKKDVETVNEILKEHNVNEKKAESVYKSIEECLKNKNAPYFNESFGLCIAKVQKIYRGNFIFKDKSLTRLMDIYPSLKSYNTNMEEFLKFKNNKFKFSSKLEGSNSSGVYISYENVKKLYNDYYVDISIRKPIDNYYKDLNNNTRENKFIQVLDYCIENKCGLLEADITIDIDNVQQINKVTPSNASNNENKDKPNYRTVSVANKAGKIIGVRILLWFATIGINLLLGTLEAYLIGKFSSSDMMFGFVESFGFSSYGSLLMLYIINIQISIIVSVLTFVPLDIIFNYKIWNKFIDSSFKYEKLEKEKKKKFVTIITVFLIIITTLGILGEIFAVKVVVNELDDSSVGVTRYLEADEKDVVSGMLLASEIMEVVSVIIAAVTAIIINTKTFLHIKRILKE